MITALFTLIVLLSTTIAITLFDAWLLEASAIWWWLLSLVIGILMGALFIVLLLFLYGRFQTGDQTKNMRNHRLINSIMRLVLRLLRTNMVITGEENIPKEPFILVGNHQTNFDIIAIKSVIKDQPLIFVAKHTLFKWPLLGRLVSLLGNIPIERLTDRSAVKAIIAGIKKYEAGVPVAIFPEGQRSFSNEMLPFKAGALKLATKPKAPILIVTIHDFNRILSWWPLRRTRVHMHFHPIIEPSFYESMNTQALSEHIKNTIQTKLNAYETA